MTIANRLVSIFAGPVASRIVKTQDSANSYVSRLHNIASCHKVCQLDPSPFDCESKKVQVGRIL